MLHTIWYEKVRYKMRVRAVGIYELKFDYDHSNKHILIIYK